METEVQTDAQTTDGQAVDEEPRADYTLRQGWLVALATTIDGPNKQYMKDQIEQRHIVPGTGEEREKWDMLRIIKDPVEHKRAVRARSNARGLIAGVCSKTKFGYLCPITRTAELKARIAAAHEVEKEFNKSAKLSQLSVFCVTAHVVQDDVEATREITRQLVNAVEIAQASLQTFDVKTVREKCNEVKSISQMLSPDKQRQVEDVIKVLRAECRKIVKAGEIASVEIDTAAMDAISTARTAFLDFGADVADVEEPEEFATRTLDLRPHDELESVVEPEVTTREVDGEQAAFDIDPEIAEMSDEDVAEFFTDNPFDDVLDDDVDVDDESES